MNSLLRLKSSIALLAVVAAVLASPKSSPQSGVVAYRAGVYDKIQLIFNKIITPSITLERD